MGLAGAGPIAAGWGQDRACWPSGGRGWALLGLWVDRVQGSDRASGYGAWPARFLEMGQGIGKGGYCTHKGYYTNRVQGAGLGRGRGQDW